MQKTICIAGKNSIAVQGLSHILKNYSQHKICYLPNQSDSGIDSWQPSFIKYAEEKLVKKTNINELLKIEGLIFISLEYEKIINPEVFSSQELFNIHFSLLPRYKGMFTSTFPILNGDKKTGVTLHKIDSGIDTGNIIDQMEFEITTEDNARALYFKYLKYSQVLFLKNIDKIIAGNYREESQSSTGSTYNSKTSIDYSSIKANLNKTAYEIHNHFRAYNFREYQIPKFNDWQIIKTEITEEKSSSKSGKILQETDEFFLISTVDYNIKLYKDYYPLLWSESEIGNLDQVATALKYVSDINLKNEKGWNALIIAAFNGRLNVANELIEHGANTSSTNHKGTSVLMYAFSHFEKTNDSRVFKLLLRSGANQHSKDMYGKKLIDYMCERGNLDLAHYLDLKARN